MGCFAWPHTFFGSGQIGFSGSVKSHGSSATKSKVVNSVSTKANGGTKDGDVSVPINVAYNHHYGFNLLSSGASMQHVPTPPIGTDKITSHPGPNPGYSYIFSDQAGMA